MLTFKIPHGNEERNAPRVSHSSDDLLVLDDVQIEKKEYEDVFTKPIHDLVAEFAGEKKNPRDLPELGGEPLELEDMKYMQVGALRVIYYDLGGTEDVSKSTKNSLLKKIEWLQNQKTKTF